MRTRKSALRPNGSRNRGPRFLTLESLEPRHLLSGGDAMERGPRIVSVEILEPRHLLSGGDAMEFGAAALDPPLDRTPATVQVRMQATDLCGRPIASVPTGARFWLEIYVEDLRAIPKGVFAAYLDVDYDPAFVSTTAQDRREFTFGLDYRNGRTGVVADGLLDDAGAFAGFTQLLGGEQLLFAVPLVATAPGVADFAGRPADGVGNQFLIYGSDSPVPPQEIRIVGATLTIDGGAASGSTPTGSGCAGWVVAGSGADLTRPEPLAQPRDTFDWSNDPDDLTIGELPDNDDGSGGLPAVADYAWASTGRTVFYSRYWYDGTAGEVESGRSVPIVFITVPGDPGARRGWHGMPATINRPAPGSGSIVQPAAPLGMLASGGLAGQSVRWTARPFPAVASPATSDRIFAQLGRRHGPQSAAAADGWEDLDDWLEIDAGEGETSGRILTV